MLFGMYNVGYQHYLSIGELASTSFWLIFFGFLGSFTQNRRSIRSWIGNRVYRRPNTADHKYKKDSVSGHALIPMIVPVDTPLWMPIAVATAFAVIFAKEVFGGTGTNIFNIALVIQVSSLIHQNVRRRSLYPHERYIRIRSQSNSRRLGVTLSDKPLPIQEGHSN